MSRHIVSKLLKNTNKTLKVEHLSGSAGVACDSSSQGCGSEPYTGCKDLLKIKS